MTLPDDPLPAPFRDESARARIAAIAESHRRLTGRPLVARGEGGGEDWATALWRAPQVIVAHGGGADPVFNFANRAALRAFETTLDAMLAMPSRLSAEPDRREERSRLLARVTAQGFIDDYAGLRISARGRRFAISRATVWNVLDGEGHRISQAATFAAPDHARD